MGHCAVVVVMSATIVWPLLLMWVKWQWCATEYSHAFLWWLSPLALASQRKTNWCDSGNIYIRWMRRKKNKWNAIKVTRIAFILITAIISSAESLLDSIFLPELRRERKRKKIKKETKTANNGYLQRMWKGIWKESVFWQMKRHYINAKATCNNLWSR